MIVNGLGADNSSNRSFWRRENDHAAADSIPNSKSCIRLSNLTAVRLFFQEIL